MALSLVASAAPASAANYTWLNANHRSNVTYTEGAASSGFARKGIEAFLSNADGYTWKTTVWLGTVSTSGQESAAISDGALSYAKTKARFIYLPAPDTRDLMKFRATVTGIPGGGMSRSVSENTSLSTVAEASYGDSVITASASDDGRVTLEATSGTFTGSSSAEAETVYSTGLTVRIDNGDDSIQAVYAPGDFDRTVLEAEGLVDIGSGIWIDPNVNQRASDEVLSVDGFAARGASQSGIILFGLPVE